MEDELKHTVNRNFLKIIDLHSRQNDFFYWQTQSIEKRLETLELLRTQYMTWKYGTKPRFQRVYRIIERP